MIKNRIWIEVEIRSNVQTLYIIDGYDIQEQICINRSAVGYKFYIRRIILGSTLAEIYISGHMCEAEILESYILNCICLYKLPNDIRI